MACSLACSLADPVDKWWMRGGWISRECGACSRALMPIHPGTPSPFRPACLLNRRISPAADTESDRLPVLVIATVTVTTTATAQLPDSLISNHYSLYQIHTTQNGIGARVGAGTGTGTGIKAKTRISN